ncbi:syntaxin-112 [Euphorbia lathyris]|uniref:syntaxin-112 n=1 Tax=Euphorbia lathyris TaxID=212925 RepID=UPI003313E849
MNDLMTKSFLSYVELKKHVQMDQLESKIDIEQQSTNLSQFFQQVSAIKLEMEEITNLLFHLQTLSKEAKSTHSNKVLRGLRDRTESDMVTVLRKAKTVKSKLESLQSNEMVDGTRISVANGLKIRLKELMNEFQLLREKILSDHKSDLKRRYYATTGEEPSEEIVEKMISGEMEVESKEKHEGVMDLQRSLTKLHQVFLDMAVIVETQGEKMDNIEENVVNAAYSVNGGTNSLYYANQMKQKKKTKAWVYFLWALMLIILLVCIVSMLVT